MTVGFNSSAGGFEVGDIVYFDDFEIIDLTRAFGAGYEPATTTDFVAIFNGEYATNPGTLLPYKGTGLKTTGVNQWDEQWELGTFTSTGAEQASTNRWRSKNYTQIISPNTTYYISAPYAMTIYFYDADKNFIYRINSGGANVNFEFTPNAYPGVMYFRITTYSTYNTYNHDICINLSNLSINGQYFPYEEHTLSLPVVGKTAKDGNGNTIVPFPEGMNGTPTVYDLARKADGEVRFGIVDLGEPTWEELATDTAGKKRFGCELTIPAKYGGTSNIPLIVCPRYIAASNESTYVASQYDKIVSTRSNGGLIILDSAYTDAATFKAAMAGVKLVYELATPVPFTWDTPMDNIYPAPAGGTEMLLPQGVDTNGVPATTPMEATIFYSKDYVQTINDMPKDFDTTASIDALTTALATTLSTALNGTFTITRGAYDESAKKYAWNVSFTSDEEE
jgi:hypothetical protein